MWHTCSSIRLSNCAATTSASPSRSTSTKSTISPARLRRSTTRTTRSRPFKPTWSAPSTCSNWPGAAAPYCCRPRPARFTGIRWCIPRPRPIAATSTRSAPVPATTRGSAVLKPSVSIITGKAEYASRWPASSIPTGRACMSTMAGWFLILWSRRSRGKRSPSTAAAARLAPSAT